MTHNQTTQTNSSEQKAASQHTTNSQNTEEQQNNYSDGYSTPTKKRQAIIIEPETPKHNILQNSNPLTDKPSVEPITYMLLNSIASTIEQDLQQNNQQMQKLLEAITTSKKLGQSEETIQNYRLYTGTWETEENEANIKEIQSIFEDLSNINTGHEYWIDISLKEYENESQLEENKSQLEENEANLKTYELIVDLNFAEAFISSTQAHNTNTKMEEYKTFVTNQIIKPLTEFMLSYNPGNNHITNVIQINNTFTGNNNSIYNNLNASVNEFSAHNNPNNRALTQNSINNAHSSNQTKVQNPSEAPVTRKRVIVPADDCKKINLYNDPKQRRMNPTHSEQNITKQATEINPIAQLIFQKFLNDIADQTPLPDHFECPDMVLDLALKTGFKQCPNKPRTLMLPNDITIEARNKMQNQYNMKLSTINKLESTILTSKVLNGQIKQNIYVCDITISNIETFIHTLISDLGGSGFFALKNNDNAVKACLAQVFSTAQVYEVNIEIKNETYDYLLSCAYPELNKDAILFNTVLTSCKAAWQKDLDKEFETLVPSALDQTKYTITISNPGDTYRVPYYLHTLKELGFKIKLETINITVEIGLEDNIEQESDLNLNILYLFNLRQFFNKHCYFQNGIQFVDKHSEFKKANINGELLLMHFYEQLNYLFSPTFKAAAAQNIAKYTAINSNTR